MMNRVYTGSTHIPSEGTNGQAPFELLDSGCRLHKRCLFTGSSLDTGIYRIIGFA